MQDAMWFDGWSGLLRVAVVGTLAYVGLIILLRGSGKRTLSKMNIFDFVVTVALGSTLGTVMLSNDIALAEGITAFAVLVVLQFTITWISVRAPWFERLVKAEPTLLYSRGQFLHGAMKRQRITESEVRAAVRAEGLADVEHAVAVVLETDGSLSVLQKGDPESLILNQDRHAS